MRIIYVIKHESIITRYVCYVREVDIKAKIFRVSKQILEAKWFKSSRSAKAYITKNNLAKGAKNIGGRLFVVGYKVNIYSKSGRCKLIESTELK